MLLVPSVGYGCTKNASRSNRMKGIDDDKCPLTSSRAVAGRGNKARETPRSENPGEGERTSPDDERESPNLERGELCQASLHENTDGQPSIYGEASISREETDKCTCRVGRGKRRGRYLKELLRRLGDPLKRRPVRQVPPGIYNWIGTLEWESDEPVVAKNRGNAWGAKGL